jgi:hypothetical protein
MYISQPNAVMNYKIIESTLREGEQFAGAHFNTQDKLEIAAALDQFGVEYLELTTPVASPMSENDLQTIARMPRKFRLLTHIRAKLDEAKLAVDCGVDGVGHLHRHLCLYAPVQSWQELDADCRGRAKNSFVAQVAGHRDPFQH